MLLTQDRKITGTLQAADDKVRVFADALATVTFQFAAGLVGTVTFEGTDDDATNPVFVAIPATNVATGTRATTIANPASAIYRVDASGLRTVQARVSAYTSGSAAVIANGSLAPYSDPSGVAGGGGGGGGAVTVVDGGDIAQGTTTDAGIITDTSGTVIGFLRGAIKMWINYLARIPAALTGSGNFKVSVAESTATVTTAGGKTNNNAAPGATNVGVLPALANAAAPTWTEGNQVAASVDLAGFQRGIVMGNVATGGTAVGLNPVVIGMNGAGALIRFFTEANAAAGTTGTGVVGEGPLVFDGTNYQKLRGDTTGLGLAIGVVGPAKLEDAGHTSGDNGIFALAVRQDTQSALAGTTLDYIPFTTDQNGSLRGVSGGYTTVITTTLTRPADTTAYAAGDEMTDTGGAIQTITGAARFSGGSGIIQGIYVSQSTLWTTKPQMEIWIYDTTSTPVADNGAFAPTDAVTDTCIAVIPVTATYAGTVNQALDSGLISVPFLTVGSANLFFRVVIRNAAQDSANSGVSKFRFRILQD